MWNRYKTKGVEKEETEGNQVVASNPFFLSPCQNKFTNCNKNPFGQVEPTKSPALMNPFVTKNPFSLNPTNPFEKTEPTKSPAVMNPFLTKNPFSVNPTNPFVTTIDPFQQNSKPLHLVTCITNLFINYKEFVWIQKACRS